MYQPVVKSNMVVNYYILLHHHASTPGKFVEEGGGGEGKKSPVITGKTPVMFYFAINMHLDDLAFKIVLTSSIECNKVLELEILG